ncbi:MAG: hypothetical protein KH414_16240 [Tannerella sp.]|nr:hypothetical protein [Tannerella sp.]
MSRPCTYNVRAGGRRPALDCPALWAELITMDMIPIQGYDSLQELLAILPDYMI